MKINFGIIGLGNISKRFAGVLNTFDGAKLTAVASRDIVKAEEFSKEFEVQRFYGNYEEMVKDPEVQIIYIGTIHPTHYEVAKLCIENKKAVICEKPFFMNKKEAEEIWSLAREKNVLVMEAMWTRCMPAVRKATQWARNDIGNIRVIDASFCFNIPYMPQHRLFDLKLGGGALLDAGVYPIEFITGIMGKKPIKVASVADFAPNGADQNVAISMLFDGGAVATAKTSIRANVSADAVIYGEKGRVVVYDFLRSTKAELYDEKNNLVDTFEEPVNDGFIYQIQHVCELYKSGKIESELIPMGDTIDCAEIFDMVKEQNNLKY